MEIEQYTDESVEQFIHKITTLEQQIKFTLHNSERRRKKRKEMLAAHRRNKSKQIIMLQQTNRNQQSPIKTQKQTKKDALGGMVMQVAFKNQTNGFSSDPYSAADSHYYVSEVLKGYKDSKSVVKEHLTTSLQILKSMQNSKVPSKMQIKDKLLSLPRRPGYQNKKTIVFDMDETLIHCNETLEQQYDIKITIKFPKGDSTEAGINIRPGAVELLRSLKDKFQVMVFTASQSCYANQILDYLDPRGDLIHHRLYREHCTISPSGYFVKDLRILGRPMKDVLLVDNAAYSYAYQLDNGVPILPYFKGKNDYQLKALQNYLLRLSCQDQLRTSNSRFFKLSRYMQFNDNLDSLVHELYVAEGVN